MATYVNDLRLKEIATGDESGTWGTSTNTNLELIGEALGFGTEAITTNADTHTTTVADGSTDPGRAMYLKYTGTLDSACTITIAPNTISRMQFIENGTSGSQNIIISQGTGANVTIPAGDTKAVYLDGAGSGAAVVDAFASLNTVDLKVEDDLTVTDDASIGGDATVTGTLGVSGLLTANANVTLAGTTPTLTIGDAGAEDTKIVFDGNAQDFYIALDDSADDLLVGLGSTVGTTPIISITEAGAVTLKNVGTGDDNPMSLTLQTSETDIAANDVLGKISFQAPDEGTGTDAILVAAAIQAISEGDFSSSSNATSLAFMTGASEAATTKMTLTSGGLLGIGTASPGAVVEIVDDAAAAPGTALKVHSNQNSAASDGLVFIHSEQSLAPFTALNVRQDGTGDILNLLDGTTEVFTVTNGGNVGIATSTPGSFDSEANNLVVGSGSGDQGMTIFTGSSVGNHGSIFFADATGSPKQGQIRYEQNNEVMSFFTNATEAMRIDLNGNVGIGTSAPHEMLHVEGANGTEILCAVKEDTAGALASLFFKVDSTGTDVRKKAALIFERDDPGTRGTGKLHICVDGTNDEGSASLADSRMTFDAGGDVRIGTSSALISSTEVISVNNNQRGNTLALYTQGADQHFSIDMWNTVGGTCNQVQFRAGGSGAVTGTITSQGNNSTQYNTSSDYRLKENVNYTWDATTRLKQLKPAQFNWISDETNTAVDGFLAHEVSSIVPQAVTGEKDATETIIDLDGKEKTIEVYQGIDHSVLVPLLVKTIQELEARITTLEGG